MVLSGLNINSATSQVKTHPYSHLRDILLDQLLINARESLYDQLYNQILDQLWMDCQRYLSKL